MGVFRKFWRRDRGVSSQTMAAVAASSVQPDRPKGPVISDMALAEARGAFGEALNPWKLPSPPPWIGGQTEAMAMDRAGGPGISDIYNWAVNGAFSEGLGFLGYPYLAELSQRPEYRRVSEIWASEATRKWIKLGGSTPERIDAIEKQLARFKIRDRFRRLAELDGFFGRGQLFVDLGHAITSPELAKPLIAKAKVKPRSIKNFKVVEPFWSYPGSYQSSNPLAPDFYIPRQWFVMNGDVHATRLLTIVGREMPDMLKPAYSFGGLSLSQMVKPYVDNWLRTRQSVSDLLHSFSTMVLATDMSTILGGGQAKSLLDRLDLFNRARDNRGVMAINKESEELTNVSTPLGTLDKLQAQAQEQIASVSGIPLVVLLGVTPSGLNASSDGEIRTFYATIKAYQERVFRDPLQRVLDLVQYDLDGQCDETLTFEFLDLWETPESEKAQIRKSDADMDVAYVGAGIVSNEEVRARIVQDEDSPYFGMELDDNAPEMPGEEEVDEDGNPLPDGPDDDGGPGDDDSDPDGDKPGLAQDAGKWDEGKHPRAKNGQFGSGGGGGSSPAPKPEKTGAKGEKDGGKSPAPAAAGGSSAEAKVQSLIDPETVSSLPDPAALRQPAKSWEELTTKGEEGLAEFKGKLGKVAEALKLRTDVKSPEDLGTAGEGSFLFVAPNKSEARAAEKVQADYGGDWSQLRDMVRASIVVDNIDQLKDAVAKVNAAGLSFAGKPKNKFAKPTPEGYRDLNTLVRLENGMVAELQFHVRDMIVAKEKAHDAYARQQKLQRKNGSEEPNDKWSAADTRKFEELRAEQVKLYGDAWKAATGGA